MYRTNTFSAGTVQLAANQSVISTGPYALIRHPMYSGGIVLFAGTPLALNSLWGLLIMVPFVALLIWRLRGEERFLVRELIGYADYVKTVKYRLVPFVW